MTVSRIAIAVAVSLCLGAVRASAERPESERERDRQIGPIGGVVFYWLPPIAPPPTRVGDFVPTLSPIVSIDVLGPGGNVVRRLVTYTREAAAPDGELVRVKLQGQRDGDDERGRDRRGDADDDDRAGYYWVKWSTSRYNLTIGGTYRVSVSLDGRALGTADVLVVRDGRDSDDRDRGRPLRLGRGDTLLIRFLLDGDERNRCAGVVCSASDQCHAAGACDPATGQCSNPAKPNGSACNDGNACTQTDACQSGVCTGGNPVVCTASDQCHAAGTCDPASGACSNPAKADGSACNDGNACTQTDVCQSGVCTGGNPVVCTASDQCHAAGTCDPGSGACSNPAKADGSACNDGNACTQTDACQSGVCTGGNPVVCTASDQCHAAGTCHPGSGACSNPAKADGSACNDGNACTQTDVCQSGVCTGGNPVICTAGDQCHLPATCDPATGQCSNLFPLGGQLCRPAFCASATLFYPAGTWNDSGECVTGAAQDCSALVPDGICSPLGCRGPCAANVCDGAVFHEAETVLDGGSCIAGGTRDCGALAGTCRESVCTTSGCQVVNSGPKSCSIDSCHAAGTCDPATGECSAVRVVAQVNASETFDYAPGVSISGLDGGSGWSSAWRHTDLSGGELSIADPGASREGWTTAGNRATWSTGGSTGLAQEERDVARQSCGSVYVQFLIQSSAASGADVPMLRLYDSSATACAPSSLTGAFGGSADLDAGQMCILGATSATGCSLRPNQAAGSCGAALRSGQNLVVARIDYDANRTSLWLNPDPATFDYAHPATPPAAEWPGFAPTFDRVEMTCRQPCDIDEIRIFSDVATALDPEATTADDHTPPAVTMLRPTLNEPVTEGTPVSVQVQARDDVFLDRIEIATGPTPDQLRTVFVRDMHHDRIGSCGPIVFESTENRTVCLDPTNTCTIGEDRALQTKWAVCDDGVVQEEFPPMLVVEGSALDRYSPLIDGSHPCRFASEGQRCGGPIPVPLLANLAAVDQAPYYIAARARDVNGNFSPWSTQPIVVTRDLEPTVAISCPADGDTVAPGSTVAVTLLADDDLGIASATLFVNGAPLLPRTAAPWSFAVPVPAGASTIQLQAEVADTFGHRVRSQLVRLAVGP